MKKVILFLFAAVILLTTSCRSGCESTKAPLINITFIPSFIVKKEATSDPIRDAFVDMQIYKTYCDGRISGKFNFSGLTNGLGFYSPNYLFTYKYENSNDEVTLVVTVTKSPYKSETLTYKYNYKKAVFESDDLHTIATTNIIHLKEK
jgi:hypothetical protein